LPVGRPAQEPVREPLEFESTPPPAFGKLSDGVELALVHLKVSRRELTFASLALATVPAGGLLKAVASGRRSGESDAGILRYRSTLVNGLTPEDIDWDGRKWRCTMGSTWHAGMDYCLRLSEGMARFELHDTIFDRPAGDPDRKRRSELHYPKRPRLPNDVPLWGAMSFIHHSWADPSGMARLTLGGAHGQIHIGSKAGGSPAVAFHRYKDGNFLVTTRGEQESGNTKRYKAPLAFDRPHDLVYRVVLSPTNGSLAVWLNRQKIVDLDGVPIGSHFAESYWNIGAYYYGGVTCPIVAEFANHVYPSPETLLKRTAITPAWPLA
jgi:hypothetical protein